MAKSTIPSVLHLGSKLRLCNAFMRAIIHERQILSFELDAGNIDQAAYETAIIALDNDEGFLKKEVTALTEIKQQ